MRSRKRKYNISSMRRRRFHRRQRPFLTLIASIFLLCGSTYCVLVNSSSLRAILIKALEELSSSILGGEVLGLSPTTEPIILIYRNIRFPPALLPLRPSVSSRSVVTQNRQRWR